MNLDDDKLPTAPACFIDRYAQKAGKNIKRVNKKTLELLQSYPWPGNIRELQKVIERSRIQALSRSASLRPVPHEPKNVHAEFF